MGLTLGSLRALNNEMEKNIVSLNVIDFNEVQPVYVYHRKYTAIDSILKDFCEFLAKKGGFYD